MRTEEKAKHQHRGHGGEEEVEEFKVEELKAKDKERINTECTENGVHREHRGEGVCGLMRRRQQFESGKIPAVERSWREE